ncbi:MAG: hypothetical protein K6T73_01220 [Candidatus Bathyarchaeota archaeon]|nr:hypothetical protein [Candidatus Bathyarchaeota archaeon]
MPEKKNFDPVTTIALVNGLLSLAMNLWSSARQVYGEDAIPSWEEIVEKNLDLQRKIEAEK